jgi:hypothetical protein
MQLGNRVRTEWGTAPSSIARARQSFNAALPREGRIQRACRRAFIASGGRPLSMRELRQWAYPGQLRKRWHRWSIVRALRRLGAVLTQTR